jgi:hypothetical protein
MGLKTNVENGCDLAQSTWLSASAAIGAFAVEHDFVPLHCKPPWGQAQNSSDTSQKVEEPAAMEAEKEMMMMVRSGFVMSRQTRYFHDPGFALFDELLQCPVNSGSSQVGYLLLRLLADFVRRQGAFRP